MSNHFSAVNGFIKTLISLAEHQQGASSQGIGSMTDGSTKLEIHATTITDMPNLQKGTPISVTGTVCHGIVKTYMNQSTKLNIIKDKILSNERYM